MSNPIEEYINSLEGKSDLDPVTVASELHGLATQELSTREAKIELLKADIAERDARITKISHDLTVQKANNLDLVMQVPGNPNQAETRNDDTEVQPGSPNIKVSDLFNKNTRQRHFRNG